MKIKFIAEETGIPREIISKFKNSKRDLYPESLEVLNNYLENHQNSYLSQIKMQQNKSVLNGKCISHCITMLSNCKNNVGEMF